MKDKIWLSSPHMGGNEQKYVQEAFESNWVAPMGAQLDTFEKELECYLQTSQKVVALNSGTAAIHLALIQLGVGIGDEVLCQSFTFSATANPITYVGATPVFIDSEADTWNMCPKLLEEAIKSRISNGKKPKAIIAMHAYGMPYKISEIHQIASTYQIPILEDAASALGSTYKNKACGSYGTYGVWSFNGNKIITTSGGGALLCNSATEKEHAIFLATQARDTAPHYQHTHVGYNYRMSNIVAGIGRGQLEVLDQRVAQRRANFEFYKTALAGYAQLQFLEESSGSFSNRWLSCVLTPSFKIREQLRLALAEEQIESRPLWKPMHLQPVFATCRSFANGVSEDLFNRGLCLPSGSNLTLDNLQKVVEVIKQRLD
ncbi:dTDP-4-amino-4,6-dideoxygalactose transaminase [Lutibacter oricola]|uniref:dTDP-4-amino-4,6-dideoxygalactose transaminase n=1 Tax=Lutibacter oricola TaxID=762486 RepID=A0A1H3FQY8_9FLAO|nr:aminotransferase class I/II-fold pyridoxal phosphate-dependent enzyme [Lutibacter oricola]SDX93275.1 dTDP-4-amino-4,6-dideoxygalactose transaminase [Lutibacter oricola]